MIASLSRHTAVLTMAALLAACSGTDADGDPNDVPAADVDDATAAADEGPDEPDGCEPLRAIHDTFEDAVDRRHENLDDAADAPPLGEDSEPERVSVTAYEDLLAQYQSLAEKLGDGAPLIEDQRIEPLEQVIGTADDGEVGVAGRAEEVPDRLGLEALPTWRLLPDGLTLECDDLRGDERVIQAGRTPDGPPRLSDESIAEMVLTPVHELAESDDDVTYALSIVFDTDGLIDGLANAVGNDFTHIEGEANRNYGLSRHRWQFTIWPQDGHEPAADGRRAEVEAAIDSTWLQRRLPADVDLDDDGYATFTTDGTLRAEGMLPDGDAQRVVLLHDPGNDVGIAVSVPAAVDATQARATLDEIVGHLDLVEP